jgi:hypothetical protein
MAGDGKLLSAALGADIPDSNMELTGDGNFYRLDAADQAR